jgi:hypothetical protein
MKKRMVYMHNIILPRKYALVVDHINKDKLDNRLANLCLVGNLENITRSRPRRDRIFKGVYPVSSGRWVAKIGNKNKNIHLGTFDTEKEAATAYNKLAKKFYGKRAYQN